MEQVNGKQEVIREMRGPGAWESEAVIIYIILLNGRKLSVVAKHKHLGVILSTKLSHVDEAVAITWKAAKSVGAEGNRWENRHRFKVLVSYELSYASMASIYKYILFIKRGRVLSFRHM